MIFSTHYLSPIGDLLIACKDDSLIGLWIENQKYFLSGFNEEFIEAKGVKVLDRTVNWLDRYFAGDRPCANELSLNPVGSDFRKEVWKILCDIPYGKVVSYNDIAKEIARRRGTYRMSAQAIGGAVGHNPISIVIPCHRVVGASGSLTGYAGGLDVKRFLLEHEQVDMSRLFMPKKGCCL